MKLSIIVLIAIFSLSAFANPFAGEITLGTGEKIIKVTVGDDNQSSARLLRRIQRLERAVADLQNKVYDLPAEEVWECQLKAFGNMFFGKGTSENMARSSAIKLCLTKYNAMFCEDDDIESCKQL